MASVCVDASLVLMLLLPDENNERVDALWSEWQREHTDLVAPPLLYAEVPSVIRAAVYFDRITSEEGNSAFETFCDMLIRVNARPDLHIIAWELALRHSRPRVYDAFYLAAAQTEGCDLWTGDRRLSNAVSLPWVRWIGGSER